MTHLLIAVAGITPAIVTESLYGLAAVHGVRLGGLRVLTTASGAERLRPQLFPQIQRLVQAYPKLFKGFDFNEHRDLLICRGCDGAELYDIRTHADNECVADWLLETLRPLAADPALTLHASLAGGRKTMSFYLGTVMQLLSRPHDRLYHVLIPEEFEKRKDFFFPAPGEPVAIDMAEIPFVRLGKLLPATPQLAHLGFSQLVARAQNALAGPKLQVHVHWHQDRKAKRRIEFKDPARPDEAVLTLAPRGNSRPFVYYTYLLWRRATTPPGQDDDLTLCEIAARLIDWAYQLGSGEALFEPDDNIHTLRQYAAGKEGFGEEEWWGRDFGNALCKLNHQLLDKFADAPEHEPGPYMIDKGSGSRCKLPPELIHFHPPIAEVPKHADRPTQPAARATNGHSSGNGRSRTLS